MAKSFKLNLPREINLDLTSIEKYKQTLEKYSDKIPNAVGNAVKRTSEEGLKNNFEATEIIPVEISNKKVSGGIVDKDKKDKFREYGTGIVGSNNPHANEELTRAGWVYDVNNHGEEGWVYKDEAGNYWRTKGQPAQKKFYEASKRMEEKLPEFIEEELSKLGGE